MPILFLTSCEFYFPWCMHTQMVLTLNKEKYISVSFAPGFGVRSKRERWGPLPQVWRSTVCIYIFLSESLTQYAYAACLHYSQQKHSWELSWNTLPRKGTSFLLHFFSFTSSFLAVGFSLDPLLLGLLSWQLRISGSGFLVLLRFKGICWCIYSNYV